MLTNIFIVGTGRSGTHFLCRILRDFERVEDHMGGHENHPIRDRLTRLALQHRPLDPHVLEHYHEQTRLCQRQDRIFLDQSHTNLFHVDQLAREFPGAIFLATDRPMEQTVASMLRHPGVMNWFDRALTDQSFAFPNQFLGVRCRADIEATARHMLCVNRIRAHDRHRDELLRRHGDRVRLVRFVQLVRDPHAHLCDVLTAGEVRALGTYQQTEMPDPRALTRYQTHLDDKILREIVDA